MDEGRPPDPPFRGIRDAEVSGRTFLRNALLFALGARAAGASPPTSAGAVDFTRALTIVDIGDRTQVHAAGSAIFVRRRDDLPVYDEVFAEFWRRHELRVAPPADDATVPRPPSDRERPGGDVESRPEAPGGPRAGTPRRADPAGDEEEADGEAAIVSPRAYSAAEAFRHREFERMTAAEVREAERVIDLLRPRLESRRTRRQELHPHGTHARAARDAPPEPQDRRRPGGLGLAAAHASTALDRRHLRRLGLDGAPQPAAPALRARALPLARACTPRRSSSART